MYKCILLVFCLILGFSSHAVAQGLRDCGFGFDVDTQSSAFQSMVVDGEKKRGFWLSINRAPADVRSLAKHIGRLQVCLMTPDGKSRSIQRGGSAIELKSPFVANCTAALLPNNRLLTNAHCFYDPDLERAGFSIVREARIDFNYTSKDDIGTVRTYLVSPRELTIDKDLDAMILQVLGGDANADLGGHIPMKMMSEVEPFQALGMIHHPGSDPQQYSSGTCQVDRRQTEIPGARSPFRHTCESMGGSSGSLLFDSRTLAVVALHNQGGLQPTGDSFNSGHKIGMIEAALNLGFEEYEQRKQERASDSAQQALHKLIADFPGTPEEGKAKFALEQLSGPNNAAEQTANISESDDFDIPNSLGRPWCKNSSLSLTEITVCNSQELSLLDEELIGVYGHAKSDTSDTEQMNWLRRRRDACGNDVACLVSEYKSRISQLRNNRFGLQHAQGLNRTGYCHLIVGAGRTLAEANDLVQFYPTFAHAQIFKSQNGWYAFSLGQVSSETSSGVIGQLTDRDLIPSDSYCSKGELFTVRIALSSNAEIAPKTYYVRPPRDGWLNIRTGPGTQYEVLGRVGRGQEGVPIRSQGNWSEFDWQNGLIGWAYQTYVSAVPVRKHNCTGRVVGLSPIEQYNSSTGTGFLSIRSHPTTRQGHRLSELYLGDEVLVFEETQSWASVVCMSGNCLNPNRGDSASSGWASKKYLDITCS